ncbi:hypothetical protein [Ottowia oryzae]|uniref:Uncharacterized protein n=1 Tax=Ottowia oryzae TaxID=2109914 RepID=A0A2S0MIK7_9BURK|nr:hypothetical protein [Ottowia oryzae]AVO35533.1 hypothetical protein C6570_15880 [Ottowia oryzae]
MGDTHHAIAIGAPCSRSIRAEGHSGGVPIQRAGSPAALPVTTTADFRHTGYALRSRFASFNHNACGQVPQALKQVCENQALETSP